MWQKLFFAIAILLTLLAFLLISGSGTIAQGARQHAALASQVALGTAFTYQGQLLNNGEPVNDTCNFQFELWNDLDTGTQIGATFPVTDVTVVNGRFTVQLDFGQVFAGTALWLGVAVLCPTDPAYIALNPRQPLTAAPYALALPGLWTQQNDASPNIIGGHISNTVAAGVYGATIGGGGSQNTPNQVAGNLSTIGGGSGNTAGGNNATVGGGASNAANNYGATVGGGQDNIANGSWSIIGGGFRNQDSGQRAAICGGQDNTTGGWYTTIGGGANNTANAYGATVPGGLDGIASHFGEMAYAGGRFANAGDAQTSVYIMRRTTANGLQTSLFLGGSSYITQSLTITSNRTVAFDILVVARSDGGTSAAYRLSGVIDNDSGATSMIGTPDHIVMGEDTDATGWDAMVQANDAQDALDVQVIGSWGVTIRWVAMVRTVEVQW